MRKRLDIYRHVWKLGHSVEVRKFTSDLAKESGTSGWYFHCECGKEWSK